MSEFKDVIKIYEYEKKYLVLNTIVPSWVITNINGVLFIKFCNFNIDIESTARTIHKRFSQVKYQNIVSFLRYCKDENLFRSNPYATCHKPYALNAIYFNMTPKCNLHCSYCYATSRKESQKKLLNLDDYKKIIDDSLKYTINNELTICFTGGEPLLRKETIEVANYARCKGAITKLMTNGTLITNENVNDLLQSFDEFRISLDGSNAEIHNKYRGKNAYERTINAINLLKQNNAKISLAMVVTKQNRTDVINMKNMWGNLLNFQPLFPLGNANNDSDLFLTGKEYFEALSLDPDIVPFANLKDIIRRHQNSASLFKCSMGDGEISISATGDMYPCQLLHNSDCLIGNLHDNTFDELYNSAINERFKHHTFECIDGCKDCDFRLLCGGSCQARHYSETGTLDKAGKFCEYEKLGIVQGLIKTSEMRHI